MLIRHPRVASTAKGEIIYAIGDIHGRLDLFMALMGRIKADWNRRRRPKTRLRVIVLGDFIDRGPQSQRLISLFMSLRGSPRFSVILGNHEEMMLDSIMGHDRAQRAWLASGGGATLESFGAAPRGEEEDAHAFGERIVGPIPPDVVEWIGGLPESTVSGDYLFCHTGIMPDDGAGRTGARRRLVPAWRPDRTVIVHGHVAVQEVEFRPDRISLDTLAYRTDRLSAVCLDGSERAVLES